MATLRNLSRPNLVVLLASLTLLNAASLSAQPSTATSPATAPALSLELPVLITDHEHRPVGDVTFDQLRIHFGNGAPFAPTSMRKQGEDPLSLAILIDASRDSWHDLYHLDGELAGLVGSEILPSDRISVYALDCSMTRSLLNAPPDAATLRKGIDDALHAPSLHDGNSHSSCGKSVHLWDNIAAVVAALSHAPGRRAILLISSGSDGASKYDWLTVQQYAFDQSVAIFALRDQRQSEVDDFTRGSLGVSGGTGTGHISPPPAARNATNLELLCANDGGLTLTSSPEFRKDGLADILFLIRNRFILTIPKDTYPNGGAHSAKITRTGVTPYFMTATGATEPLPSK